MTLDWNDAHANLRKPFAMESALAQVHPGRGTGGMVLHRNAPVAGNISYLRKIFSTKPVIFVEVHQPLYALGPYFPAWDDRFVCAARPTQLRRSYMRYLVRGLAMLSQDAFHTAQKTALKRHGYGQTDYNLFGNRYKAPAEGVIKGYATLLSEIYAFCSFYRFSLEYAGNITTSPTHHSAHSSLVPDWKEWAKTEFGFMVFNYKAAENFRMVFDELKKSIPYNRHQVDLFLQALAELEKVMSERPDFYDDYIRTFLSEEVLIAVPPANPAPVLAAAPVVEAVEPAGNSVETPEPPKIPQNSVGVVSLPTSQRKRKETPVWWPWGDSS